MVRLVPNLFLNRSPVSAVATIGLLSITASVQVHDAALAKDDNAEIRAISQPPALDDLPHFSNNAQFLGGFVDQGVPKKKAYILRYGTNHAGPQVIRWYLNSLDSFGWSITSNSSQSIVATKKTGSRLRINIQAPLKGFRCCYSIIYRQMAL